MIHTPTPWHIAPYSAPYIATSHDPKIKAYLEETGTDKFDALSIGTETGSAALIPLDESSRENAEFIVKAVNCHDELVAALEDIISAEGTERDEWDAVERLIPEIVTLARSALAKAKA